MTKITFERVMQKAREICTVNDVDPDSYTFNGTKDAPQWTLRTEEARKVLEREQKAAEGLSRVTDQPEQYRNSNFVICGDHDQATINQMTTCMKIGNVVAGALCADGHLGYAQPVGGVIAYENQISVSGVGFDIGCGNMAVRLDVRLKDIKYNASHLLRLIGEHISFGVGRVNDTPVDHMLFDDDFLWDKSGMADYKQKARAQLGTVGSGNHYVDLFDDEEGYVWIGVHFGSRGLGHTTATRFLKLAGGKDGINVDPTVLDVDSELGTRYIAGMNLAGRYAYAGREWVVETVRRFIGGEVTKVVHNHHNFAWNETIGGRSLWVVRKGATPAWPGQEGFIGGSMAEEAVIVRGVDSPKSAFMLHSTVHGAGRVMGRKEAIRRFTEGEMREWLEAAGVKLYGGGLDESPMAYKRLTDVLDFHRDTVEITHRLKPWLVLMAGANEKDPFKD